MAYKTFRVNGGTSGWSCHSGNQITLYGKFNYPASKTYLQKQFLVLCEGDPTRDGLNKYPEYLFVQVTKEELERVKSNLEFSKKSVYTRCQVCISGTSVKNNKFSYSEVDYAD